MASRKRARSASPKRRGPSPLLTSVLHGVRWGAQRGAPLWVVVLLVGVGAAVVQRYLEQSNAFTVQRIHEPATPGWQQPLTLLGMPLPHINVSAVAAELRRANPQMKFIRVTRQWPADLIIEAIPRRPIAQVRLREFFPVDDEGFVFTASTPAPAPSLPIIDGVEPMGQRLQPGAVATTPRVQLALRLLEALHAAPSLRQETVALVNVADAHQLTVRLQRGIEVRVGEADEVAKTLERLGPVLAKLNEQRLVPQYIDLRFADPVIGPR